MKGCLGSTAGMLLVLFGMIACFILGSTFGFWLAGGYDDDLVPETASAPVVLAADTPTVVVLPTATPEPTVVAPTAIPTPAPAVQQVAQIGKPVTVNQVMWWVFDARNLGQRLESDNQFIDPVTTSGQFIQVRFQIENQSNDLLSFGGVPLRDSQGREYTSYSGGYSFIPDGEECIFENLNPNVPKACAVIYEVAANASGLSFIATDLEIFGNQERPIALGF